MCVQEFEVARQCYTQLLQAIYHGAAAARNASSSSSSSSGIQRDGSVSGVSEEIHQWVVVLVLLFAAKQAPAAAAEPAALLTPLDSFAEMSSMRRCYCALQTARLALMHYSIVMPSAAFRHLSAHGTAPSGSGQQRGPSQVFCNLQPSAACTAEAMELLQQLLPMLAAQRRREGMCTPTPTGADSSSNSSSGSSSSSSSKSSSDPGCSTQLQQSQHSSLGCSADAGTCTVACEAFQLGCQVLEGIAMCSMSQFVLRYYKPDHATSLSALSPTANVPGSLSEDKELGEDGCVTYASQTCALLETCVRADAACLPAAAVLIHPSDRQEYAAAQGLSRTASPGSQLSGLLRLLVKTSQAARCGDLGPAAEPIM
jgi:hypothetical protein